MKNHIRGIIKMSVYFTGDTHGHIDIDKLSSKRWPEGKTLTKEDKLIILGDFGLVWNNTPDAREKYWLEWLNSKPWTTLVVKGNHENHPMFYSFPEVEMFNNKVRQIRDSIFVLETGEIYTIDGKTCLVVGGAASIDKHHRTEGLSWWPEELLSKEQENRTLENLDKVKWKVDYVLTHTGPVDILSDLFPELRIGRFSQPSWQDKFKDPVAHFLQHILNENLKFNKWYFGHFHENREHSSRKFRCFYEDIIKEEI